MRFELVLNEADTIGVACGVFAALGRMEVFKMAKENHSAALRPQPNQTTKTQRAQRKSL